MTLIEAVIWIAIFTITFLALTTSLLYFYRTNSYVLGQASAVSSGQRGIDRMVRTIREAAYSSQGAFPIASIGANDLVFYSDVDQDPLIEKVHYFLQGSSLMQGITDPVGDPPSYAGAEVASALSDFVRNADQSTSTFRYYDGTGAEITDYSHGASVRYVSAHLIMNADPNKTQNQITLESSAAIRNLTGQ